MERSELLRRFGLSEADLGDERVRRLVDDPALPPLVEAALAARLDAGKAELRLDYGPCASLLARASGEGVEVEAELGDIGVASGRGATLREALAGVAASAGFVAGAVLAVVTHVIPDDEEARAVADDLTRLAKAINRALGGSEISYSRGPGPRPARRAAEDKLSRGRRHGQALRSRQGARGPRRPPR